MLENEEELLHDEYDKLNSLYAREILKASPTQLAPSTDGSETLHIENRFMPERSEDPKKMTKISDVSPELNVGNNLNSINLKSEPTHGPNSQRRLAKVW